MSESTQELLTKVAAEVDRRDLAAASHILQEAILSLDVRPFAIALDECFDELPDLERYLRAFFEVISPVRNVRSLILQLGEIDLGSENWVLWPLTSPISRNPNLTEETFESFTKEIQGPDGYPPYKIGSFHQTKAAFDWFASLTSAQMNAPNVARAKELTYISVLIRFYSGLTTAVQHMVGKDILPQGLCVFFEDYGADDLYCVTPENLH